MTGGQEPGSGLTDHAKDHTSDLLVGWLTRAELSAQLGVAVNTLAKWTSMGVGPECIRVGPKVYYRVATVREWMAGLEAMKKRSARK